MRAHVADAPGEGRGARQVAGDHAHDALGLVVEEPVAHVVQPRRVVGDPAVAVSRVGDFADERLRRFPAALEHAREGERALEERHAVEPRQVDGANLAIVVELERPVDVRRSAKRHPDRADAVADRPLAPPALTRLGQQAVERLLTRDRAGFAGLRGKGPLRRERCGARESPRREGQEVSPTVGRLRHHFPGSHAQPSTAASRATSSARARCSAQPMTDGSGRGPADSIRRRAA
jgi:hypothetical protein